jgi:hypothetical protein
MKGETVRTHDFTKPIHLMSVALPDFAESIVAKVKNAVLV